MIIISDTTPIISLLKINRLGLLKQSFREVLIPTAVYEELTADSRFIDETMIVKGAFYIRPVAISNLEAVKILRMATGLDQGEGEAIVLTDELKADILLMHEAKGKYNFCENRIKTKSGPWSFVPQGLLLSNSN